MKNYQQQTLTSYFRGRPTEKGALISGAGIGDVAEIEPQPIPPSTTVPFAIITPCSPAAEEVIKLRRNRYLSRVTLNRKEVLKLDFSILMGRRCLAFGESRLNDVEFPLNAGVSRKQFIIQIDPRSSEVILSDTSREGTWIGTNDGAESRLLKGASVTVDKKSKIRFGEGLRYNFEIKPVIDACDAAMLADLMKKYLKSIEAFVTPEPVDTDLVSPSDDLAQETSTELRYLGGARRFDQKQEIPDSESEVSELGSVASGDTQNGVFKALERALDSSSGWAKLNGIVEDAVRKQIAEIMESLSLQDASSQGTLV